MKGTDTSVSGPLVAEGFTCRPTLTPSSKWTEEGAGIPGTAYCTSPEGKGYMYA